MRTWVRRSATPWGEASELRERRLYPGAGTPREEVARNQRERLFGAIVAVVSEKGYEATTVADVLELSGVSRSAFYKHFANKAECLAAAAAELLEPTLAALGEVERERRLARGAGESSRRSSSSCAPSPRRRGSASSSCTRPGEEGEAVGDRGFEALAETVDGAERRAAGIEQMSPELVRALIGGLRKLIHTRLDRGEEARARRAWRRSSGAG